MYIRIDDGSPDPHPNNPCPDPWLVPARRVGRCLIDASELHDWSLAGCTAHGYNGDVQCSKGPAHDCSAWGGNYEAIRCTGNGTALDSCKAFGGCGQVNSVCNGSHCVIPRGSEPGPLCRSTLAYIPLKANGTRTANYNINANFFLNFRLKMQR